MNSNFGGQNVLAIEIGMWFWCMLEQKLTAGGMISVENILMQKVIHLLTSLVQENKVFPNLH